MANAKRIVRCECKTIFDLNYDVDHSKEPIGYCPHCYKMYKYYIRRGTTVEVRYEPDMKIITEDDLLNLEISFNTAKSFEDFLAII